MATFLLMGKTGDHYMPIPAAELHRAFPNSDIALPPTIDEIRGQTLTFEVRLSRAARPGCNGDFSISRIWGLSSKPGNLRTMPTTFALGSSPLPSLPLTPYHSPSINHLNQHM
ncbi:hypothetical protein LINGRAHAP2_LOCUS14143 [Linum grandiflorum]